MGMVITFFILLYIAVAVIVIKLTKKFVTTNHYVIKTLIAIAILIPTYDIIITNILGGYYCLTSPSTTITKKVEYPISIYWEDNIYPGFNIEDRKLMIMNYLDGVHLKTMALNGDDGKVYVYSREVPKEIYKQLSSQLIQEQNQLDKLEKEFDKYDRDKDPEYLWLGIRDARLKVMEKITTIETQKRNLIDSYPTNEKIYTKATMPKMNYSVIFNEVKLPTLPAKFLYNDETKIIDNNTQETIAYNKRYMRFFYNIAPDLALGNRYYEQDSVCGTNNLYYNGDGFQYIGFYGSMEHKLGLSRHLYNKYIKGEN